MILKLRSWPLAKGFFEHLVMARYLKRVRTFSEESGTEGIEGFDYSHNKVINFSYDKRIYWTLGLLAQIPSVNKKSLLCIGPRFTTELYVAESFGFAKNGIKGIDTFSYSKRIDVGDMHKMPFPKIFFHNVLSGWTISYSSNPQLVASEMMRVLRPGGFLMLAVQFVEKEATEVIPGVLSGELRIQYLDQFDELFKPLQRIFGIEGFKPESEETRHTLVVYQKPEEFVQPDFLD
jgi:hypothetical protein